MITFYYTRQSSFMPDPSVKISKVSFVGSLRIDAELLPEFPFVGMASINFLEIPDLDIDIICFEMLRSNMILIRDILKRFIKQLLMQITYPKMASIDLKYVLCPSCSDTTDHSFRSSADVGNLEYSKSLAHLASDLKYVFHHIVNRITKKNEGM